jgi:hypothetical protein
MTKPGAKPSLQDEKKTFARKEVCVEIILPKRLDPYARKACEDQFGRYQKGFFFMQNNDRFYGVNYSIETDAEGEKLHIYDLARPALAAQNYYENFLRQDTAKSPDKWTLTQIAELNAFRKTIEKLQDQGNGTLINNLAFKEVG